MSVVQIHRPVVVAAPPTTTTATASVTESLQLTQNLLRSSIATISYLRGLFPEDHFDDSRFNGMGLKRMKRGASPRMDALVESLESGCFDALQKGYLRKIVFSVHHGASAINEDNKENNVSGACAEGALIESYEFEFKYPSTHEVTMTITAGDKSKATSKAISKKESVKAMADLLRRIIILTQTLQPLPDNAEFTTRIYYYDNITPIDYEPPHFRQGLPEDQENLPAELDLYEMGTVKTNHHILGLQVKAVPEDSKSLSSRETSDDMDHLESTQQDVAVKEEYPKEAPTIPQTQQLSQVSDLPGVLRILHQEGFVADIGGPNTVNSIVVNGPETAKPVMDTETLLCDSQVTSAEPFLPDNVMHNGQDGSQAPESPELGLLHSASLRISKRKMNQSQVSSSLSQLSSAFDSPLETMAPKHKLVVVDCQCGCTIIDMPMIQCRNCSSLSHPPCYAYESDKDFRIPSDGHLCYKCWNSIIHPSSYNLEEAANIALIRRGLFLAFRDGGIASINAFAGIIGTSVPVAKYVAETLTQGGLLRATRKSAKLTPGPHALEVIKGARRKDSYVDWMSTRSLPVSDEGYAAWRSLQDGKEKVYVEATPMEEDPGGGSDAESVIVLGKPLSGAGVRGEALESSFREASADVVVMTQESLLACTRDPANPFSPSTSIKRVESSIECVPGGMSTFSPPASQKRVKMSIALGSAHF